MSNLYSFLAEHGIEYQRCDHPPVFTVEESDRLVPPLPGAKTKNLFLRDKKGRRHFLCAAPAHRRVNLKALSTVLGADNLSFASPERLQKYLQVEPGAVTLLAVVNDPGQEVQVVIDEELWNAEACQCHPLVNTSTLVLSQQQLQRFLAATGHEPRIVRIPV
ncbi:MAG: prolyl-tRNA synthetase associated domain-containing protein [Planctomycetes bacterium]|nr:prolyl-tRNA synthetase associated domain-containing protein [Planctomycetota bacterium]